MDPQRILKKCIINLPVSAFQNRLWRVRKAYNEGRVAGVASDPTALKRGYWDGSTMPLHLKINRWGDQTIETSIRTIEGCMGMIDNVDVLNFDLYLPPDWKDEIPTLIEMDRVNFIVPVSERRNLFRYLRKHPEIPMGSVGWEEDFRNPSDAITDARRFRHVPSRGIGKQLKLIVGPEVKMDVLEKYDSRYNPHFWEVGATYADYVCSAGM